MPIIIKSYRHELKIETFVQNIVKHLKEKVEYHVKYPHYYSSPEISVSQIRSTIINAVDVTTLNDWQCVVEKIDSHPLIQKSFQEERGDFIEHWELIA
ncbi:hypothetical protein INT46_010778 [Mucor plumbeus]|uniref:Man1/Src1-like C-terminal domain-containing protein n=1 Tax=Mucor plumbeus TaxID=97098 RepID=A0A8H7R6Y8_9FUNG|nr:hypothetical protein INT46_010778 [Mucor plumbeus]